MPISQLIYVISGITNTFYYIKNKIPIMLLSNINQPTNQPTAWYAIFLEKLVVCRLIKKFLVFMNLEVYCHVYKSPLDIILNQTNSVHTFTSYLSMRHFDICAYIFQVVSSFENS